MTRFDQRKNNVILQHGKQLLTAITTVDVPGHDSSLSTQPQIGLRRDHIANPQQGSRNSRQGKREGKWSMNSKGLQLAKILMAAPLILGGCSMTVIEEKPTLEAKVHSTELAETIVADALNESTPMTTWARLPSGKITITANICYPRSGARRDAVGNCRKLILRKSCLDHGQHG